MLDVEAVKDLAPSHECAGRAGRDPASGDLMVDPKNGRARQWSRGGRQRQMLKIA
jgi:hypothetical protein